MNGYSPYQNWIKIQDELTKDKGYQINRCDESYSRTQDKLNENFDISSADAKRMEKLIVGKPYWILFSPYNDKNIGWHKCYYLGECGANNKILMFDKVYRTNIDMTELMYPVSFLKFDYLRSKLQVLDQEEYKKRKSTGLWENIEKLINAFN